MGSRFFAPGWGTLFLRAKSGESGVQQLPKRMPLMGATLQFADSDGARELERRAYRMNIASPKESMR